MPAPRWHRVRIQPRTPNQETACRIHFVLNRRCLMSGAGDLRLRAATWCSCARTSCPPWSSKASVKRCTPHSTAGCLVLDNVRR
eukprot:1210641-Rhodomonas_salina.2